MYEALKFSGPVPWQYWQVQFAERGVCTWQGFQEMDVHDVHEIIAVWDGIDKAQQVKHGAG